MTDWHICPDCGHETTTTTGLAAHGRQTHGWTPASNQTRPGPNLPGYDAWHATDRARAICHSCPVQDACLTYALDTNQTHGIWGATSPVERRAIRRRRRTAA